MLVTVKLILHLFLIGDGKLRKVQNSAPPPELPDSLLWDLKERDVDSLRGSVRRIKFEIKHHTSALVFTLFKTIKSFIHFILNAHRILREFNILQWLLSPLLSTEFSYQMEFANVSCLRFYLDSQEMRSACDSSKAANNWNPKFPFSVEKRSFFDFPVP